jgi:hypothetical protein
MDEDFLDGLDVLALQSLNCIRARDAERWEALMPERPAIAFALDKGEKAGSLRLMQAPLTVGR